MKLRISIIAGTLLTLVMTGNSLADLADITSNVNLFGVINPGIMCKTRTNNEATVRNLAHGVWNRDSATPAILNCGFPAPYPWVSDVFANSSRADGFIYITFVRSDDVSDADFQSAFCVVSVSDEEAIAQNPDTGTGTGESVTLGVASPDPAFGLEDLASVGPTDGITYPSSYNFFSAYCSLPHHVRIQVMDLDSDSVGTF